MKKTNKHLTSFADHLDEQYGVRGQFEEGFEAFKLGVMIQELRKEQGLTQEQLAEKCGPFLIRKTMLIEHYSVKYCFHHGISKLAHTRGYPISKYAAPDTCLSKPVSGRGNKRPYKPQQFYRQKFAELPFQNWRNRGRFVLY